MTIHLKRQIGRELARLEVELEQIKGRCQMTDFQSSSQPVVNNERHVEIYTYDDTIRVDPPQ